MTLRQGEVEEEELSTVRWITIFQHFPWNEEGKRATGLRRKSCNSLAGHRTWEPLVDYSADYRVSPLIWDLQNACAKDAPPIHSRNLTGKANRTQKEAEPFSGGKCDPGFQSERLTVYDGLSGWVCTQPAKLTCPTLYMKMQSARGADNCCIPVAWEKLQHRTVRRHEPFSEPTLHHLEMQQR